MSALDDAPEIIVVLGGGLLPDGSPDTSTVRRAEAAATLALARPDAAVIASGGGPLPSDSQQGAAAGRPRGPEAAHIARIASERGVAASRIVLEDESMDTVGNAVLTASRYLRALAPRPLTLVTSPFHADRAKHAFERALPGWTVRVHPSAEGPEDATRERSERAFLENNETLLAGVADGDLAAMFERLVARWPEYRRYASRIR